jgi:capsule polysaccharide export protein KpsE/RkpR
MPISDWHNSLAVDTAPTTVNPTIEQELATAKADLVKFQADHKAQTDLLTEESTKLAAALADVTKLTEEKTKVEGDLAAANAELASEKTKVTGLEASQKDFDTKVQTELARLAAATGTQTPANVTAAGTNPDAFAGKSGIELMQAAFDADLKK